MTKVAYNACYGGFDLSQEGYKKYAEIKGIKLFIEKNKYNINVYWTVPKKERMKTPENWSDLSMEERIEFNRAYENQTLRARDMDRTDVTLIKVIEELGAAASGECSNLQIEDIPSGSRYRIDEYDGYESVQSPSDIDWRVA